MKESASEHLNHAKIFLLLAAIVSALMIAMVVVGEQEERAGTNVYDISCYSGSNEIIRDQTRKVVQWGITSHFTSLKTGKKVRVTGDCVVTEQTSPSTKKD